MPMWANQTSASATARPDPVTTPTKARMAGEGRCGSGRRPPRRPAGSTGSRAGPGRVPAAARQTATRTARTCHRAGSPCPAAPRLRCGAAAAPDRSPPRHRPGSSVGRGGAKAADRRLRRWIADIAIAHRSLRAGLECQSRFGVPTVSVAKVPPCGGRPTRVQVAAVRAASRVQVYVRDAVRLSLRAHICGLVPASDVNWLTTYPDSPGVSWDARLLKQLGSVVPGRGACSSPATRLWRTSRCYRRATASCLRYSR